MIGIPIWGYILAILEPSMVDPLWLRWLITAAFAVVLFLSYKVKNKTLFIEKSMIYGGWITLIHAYGIGFASHLPVGWFCGYLILLAALLNSFPTIRSTLVLGLVNSLIGAVVAFYPGEWKTSPLLFNMSVWTIIIIASLANFARLRHLASLIDVQDKMNFLLNKMQDGLLVYNENLMPIYVNPTASKLLGYSGQQLGSMSLNQIKIFSEDGKVAEFSYHPAVEAARTGVDQAKLIGIERFDGSIIWVKAYASFFKSEGENRILLTISDLSEVRRNHKIIIEQQKQLEANAKLTALGEVAAGVAHEINNPLAIIVGKLYNIEKAFTKGKSGEPVDVSLAKIHQTIDRIRRIVKGLQTFANGGENDPLEIVETKEVISDAVMMCQQKVTESRVKVNLDLTDDCAIECRRSQITQCLINLIYNACDAIESREERWINLWARSAHQSVVITITDSGKGIPPEIREKLMQPFYTTKDPGKGTGLGLSVTRGIVTSHMGRFWYDSTSENTRFIIELPIVQSVKKLIA